MKILRVIIIGYKIYMDTIQIILLNQSIKSREIQANSKKNKK